MANHKQAEKRNRQRIRRRARNLRYLSTMRTYMKKVRRSLEASDLKEAAATLPTAITAIAKAAANGVVHRNAASRYISRLTKAVSKAKSTQSV